MESKCSHFWLGLGLGSVLGAIIYRCCQTSKARQLKEKVTNAFHQATGHAEEFVDSAKNKAMEAGTMVANKVADKTFDVAEKADEMKDKVHNFTDNTKK